jgi:hypothetical protein
LTRKIEKRGAKGCLKRAGVYRQRGLTCPPLSLLKRYMPLIIKLRSSKLRNRKPFEEREITVLSSQIRHSVIEEIQNNIKALSVLKKHGKRVGRLKFLSRCNTVELKQSSIIYRIVGNRLFVQGFKQPFSLDGGNQTSRSGEGECETDKKSVRLLSVYHRLYGEKEDEQTICSR